MGIAQSPVPRFSNVVATPLRLPDLQEHHGNTASRSRSVFAQEHRAGTSVKGPCSRWQPQAGCHPHLGGDHVHRVNPAAAQVRQTGLPMRRLPDSPASSVMVISPSATLASLPRDNALRPCLLGGTPGPIDCLGAPTRSLPLNHVREVFPITRPSEPKDAARVKRPPARRARDYKAL